MTPLSRTWLARILGLGLMACATAVAREPAHGNADRWPFGERAVDRTLVVGTLVEATIDRSLFRRRSKLGDTLTATVSTDVRNAHHWVVIPAGCPIELRIAVSGPAAHKSHADATLLLVVTSVTVWGQAYRVGATVDLTPLTVRRVTRDGVVASGTRILFVLPEGLTVERRPDNAPEGHAPVLARLPSS
jgi:hypothetical protein